MSSHQEHIKMPSQKKLNSIFQYHPETGMLSYKNIPEFSDEWNERFEGETACSIWMKDDKYPVLMVSYPINKGKKWKMYPAERIVAKILWNRNPPRITHLNGNKMDNTPHNLDLGGKY